jgi:LDH2 family malate/lactate/ureidoglycolate dehydrogenase
MSSQPSKDTAATAQAAGAVIEAPRLRQFTQLVFEKAGMRATDAELLADHLIWADLRGIAWLGVNKIPQYLDRLRAGVTSATAEPAVLGSREGFLAVDGNHAFGQVVCYHAMNLVIEKARAAGIGAAVVRNTTSAGALGYFAMMAAEEKMIGLAINNSPPLQPAWGGTEKVVGNQAFAVASPAGQHPPLLLDMATSAVTHARIHDYRQRGEPLPEGVALTADGEPTTDPAAALAGMLLPMGGHRGFGLALMWEILTGVLAGGARFSTDVAWPNAFNRPQDVSVFLLAVDPTASLPYETFLARVDDVIDRVHATKPAPGVDRVTVPGERSDETRARHSVDGIPVPADLLATLRELGAELGVSL